VEEACTSRVFPLRGARKRSAPELHHPESKQLGTISWVTFQAIASAMRERLSGKDLSCAWVRERGKMFLRESHGSAVFFFAGARTSDYLGGGPFKKEIKEEKRKHKCTLPPGRGRPKPGQRKAPHIKLKPGTISGKEGERYTPFVRSSGTTHNERKATRSDSSRGTRERRREKELSAES